MLSLEVRKNLINHGMKQMEKDQNKQEIKLLSHRKLERKQIKEEMLIAQNLNKIRN